MTGFGSCLERGKGWEFQVSVKAVNGRFFDLKMQLPSFLNQHESSLRKLVESYFERGTIELQVRASIKKLGVSKKPVLNLELFDLYHNELKKIQKNLNAKTPMVTQITDWLALPDLFNFESVEVSPTDVKALTVAVQKACQECLAERTREGSSLKKDLLLIIKLINQELSAIKNLSLSWGQDPTPAYVERITNYLEKKGLEVSEERMAEEWAYFREKAAIFEELQRLTEHLDHFKQILNSDEASCGKKLDFYTQELLREFNTIGSKTLLAQVTRHVIESKNLVERLREQVQNVQ